MNAPLATRSARSSRAPHPVQNSLWTTFRAEARAHRVALAEHKKLRAELAAYDTPAAINDLLVMVDRADESADEVRAILTQNLVDYQRHHAGRVAC